MAGDADVSVIRLDRVQLKALLLNIEDEYRRQTGEHLSSEEFFARYKADEFDTPWAMSWATYYEAWCRLNGEDCEDDVRTVASSLPPVLA